MGSVLKLIDKQVRSWELKQRVEGMMRPGRYVESGVGYGPCLLVSREYGSGGGQVGRLAAERLGWQVFDREILDQIAKLADVRLKLLETVGEQTREIWGDSWQAELAPEDIGYESYLRFLRQVVLTLGHHGDVAILGRGAQYLLPSRCALRVRVVAPLELRVQRVKEADKLSPEEAHRRVQKYDVDRADFVRKTFRREAGSPLNYDLVINTGELSLETGMELVLKALEDKLHVRSPKR